MKNEYLYRSSRGQRGVALVTALLVVSLATMAAVAMATRQHVDVRRTGNLLHGEQAYAYALAAESWALVIMDRDTEDTKNDTLEEDWATALPPISVEGGLVNGVISDLQGRFNVNNLVGEDGKPSVADRDYFKRLLLVLELDPALTNALLDWIDPDIDASYPDGAEDDTYLLNNPPYRAANRPLSSVSELGLIQGFTAEVLAVLGPHVTALPVHTGINVNTATPEILRALNENLTEADAESLIKDREGDGYEDKASFLAHDALAGVEVGVDIGVSSDWFTVQTDVMVGRGRARLKSRLLREGGPSRIVSRIRTRQRLLP
jgi:general secretion pathway protein K